MLLSLQLQIMTSLALASVLFCNGSPPLAEGSPVEDPSRKPDMLDCMKDFQTFQFDSERYDQYPIYFRDDSTITLAQAGTYTGPEAIEEYVKFTDVSSPYLSDTTGSFVHLEFKDVDQTTGICQFIMYRVARVERDPDRAKEVTKTSALLLQVDYDYHQRYIKKGKAFIPKPYLDYLFGHILNTDKTHNFVCEVSEACPNVNVGMSRQECVQGLKDLPSTSGNNAYFDGKDAGCRALHAVFAQKNQNHCAHLSFEPMEDPNGNVMCQKSEEIDPLDLFDQKDIDDFLEYLEDHPIIGSRDGFTIHDEPKELDRTKQILMGVLVPVAIVFMVFLLSLLGKRDQSAGEDDTELTSLSSRKMPDNVLFRNKSRQLWILIGFICVSILLTFLLSGLVVWLVCSSWEQRDTQSNEFADKYRGSPTKVSETAPHNLMSDEDFQVYLGFVIWACVLVTGFGLEVFVWTNFLQVWCEKREALWRFVQFIFPMMLLTCLGLAASQNYLSVPFLIFGLWKMGFPENLMYLHLGLFSKSHFGFLKFSDLLNGFGTVVHHSAASFIVCMLLAGVIPASRYAFNGPLILVIQHIFALLSYHSGYVYIAVMLVLEYYLEWTLLSDFKEYYYLHWTGAVGTGVMIFSHWVYMFAGALSLIATNGKNSPEHDNVHFRGTKDISLPSTDTTGTLTNTETEVGEVPTTQPSRNSASSRIRQRHSLRRTSLCLMQEVMEERRESMLKPHHEREFDV